MHYKTTTWNLLFDVLWRTWTYDDEFSSLFLNLNKILKKPTPGKVAYIWHIERVQIDAIKFEKNANSVFLATFSLPSSLSLHKVPSLVWWSHVEVRLRLFFQGLDARLNILTEERNLMWSCSESLWSMMLLRESNTVSRGWRSLSYRLYIERQNLPMKQFTHNYTNIINSRSLVLRL